MKIFIAAFNDISEKQINKAVNNFITKFKSAEAEDFVYDDPEVIWFLTGGSEHNALKRIESKNRYCFIASSNDNSWAAATEVKALLNEKGINTRIFDYDSLESLAPLYDYIKVQDSDKCTRLGLIGQPADWLVASIPDKDLLKEVLNIEIHEFSHGELNDVVVSSGNTAFDNIFKEYKFGSKPETSDYSAKLQSFISLHNLDAIALDCFSIIKDSSFTACLSLSAFNENNFPAVCEGDLCSAAGMIVFRRLTGQVPWMANLNYVNSGFAEFSHCTAPVSLMDGFSVDTHFETGKGAAIRGQLKKQQVTVFRVDRNLEHCFLSLGEVVETDFKENACRTQARIKMSAKSLFLLREYPLGNHHLIAPGDHTDILSGYFSNKGLRIV